MAAPFKNLINPGLIEQIAEQFSKSAGNDWNRLQFVEIACDNLENRELKERCMQIVVAMEHTFPEDFQKGASIVEGALHPETGATEFKGTEINEDGIQGWAIMAIQEWVGRNGLEHVDVSLELLKALTKRLTSEFGIRYFLDAFPYETLKKMQTWVMDPDPNVRRLVSEGTRTRLPWGMRLNRFIADPSPVVPLLEYLKDDPSEYVRRSVANNLNDLSKDHPDIVVKIASNWWQGADANRKKLIRHALRTLVKKGNADALAVLGYGEAMVRIHGFSIRPKRWSVGDQVEIELDLESTSTHSQQLVIDYAVHFQKANGSLSPKVFKWTTLSLEAEQRIRKIKRHSFAPVTTRKYYQGDHAFEVFINGTSWGNAGGVLDV